MTTSVVYKTEVKTVTGCPPWVVACPEGKHVTTVVVPLYTTVCPVDAVETPGPKQQAPDSKHQVPGNKQQTPENKQQVPGNKQQTPENNQQTPGNKQHTPENKSQSPGAKNDGAVCPPVSTTTVTVVQERIVTVFPTATSSCLVYAGVSGVATSTNSRVSGAASPTNSRVSGAAAPTHSKIAADFFEQHAESQPSKPAAGEVKRSSGAARASACMFALVVAVVAVLI